jgi:nitrogen-specific signal transduction histidine kinase
MSRNGGRHPTTDEGDRLAHRLRQSQRLESLGQLAGGVAHDFNNLVAVIVNYTAFAKEAVKAAEADEGCGRWRTVIDDLDQVELAGERAARLAHQLLAFARREVVLPRVVDVNEVIHGVEQLLHRTLGEHVRLVTAVKPHVWPVLVDPGQLEQVLVNLALNARDAMPDGGTLTIETENVAVDEAYAESRPDLRPGPYVCIRVTDEGTGMPEDVRERAFEPFFTTKPTGEGSGLGLATVYGIVGQAGGAVQLYSEPGLGTTVTAWLPATDEAPVAVEAASLARPRARAGGETVLVVEDEDALREVTRRILTRAGYEVLAVADGLEAVEVAGSYPGWIDVLVTDVVLPHVPGREVARRIRALRPSISVLFMSGYAEPALGASGRVEPDVHLLQKPFSESALLTKLRDVLDAIA